MAGTTPERCITQGATADRCVTLAAKPQVLRQVLIKSGIACPSGSLPSLPAMSPSGFSRSRSSSGQRISCSADRIRSRTISAVTWACGRPSSVSSTRVFASQLHGRGRISNFLDYIITSGGSPRLNSFGLGNWTGLAALVIVVALLAMSSDAALRKLKAQPWKWLQRLNHALFGLAILHALFYGALLRMTSPFTLLLNLSLIAVFIGQGVGVWLWRWKYAVHQPQ